MISHGIPLGRAPTIELRNMHATYAVTWYRQESHCITGDLLTYGVQVRTLSSNIVDAVETLPTACCWASKCLLPLRAVTL